MSSSTSSRYLDTSLPLEERIEDLLSQMTVPEKIAQMLHETPAIERLGVKAYSWWNEALHGVARAGSATIFPQAIGLAATFDRERAHKVATAISDEARAKYEIFDARGTTGRYCGLTFWTPNINIFRDPRWGRGQETYGEDPYLTGEIGVQFVRGLQGDDPHYLKTAACAKHYAVHSGPEKIRHSFDAIVSAYDLEDTYLPAFKKLVQIAKVESVMGAYNRTNGEPCCGSEFLLKKTLRGDWGFKGHVVSDCWALVDFHEHHHVTKTPAESAALALKMGCDLNCGVTFPFLVDALVQGLVVEEDINVAMRRLLATRFKLGEFDPKEKVPYRSIPSSVIRSAEHLALCHETAVRSMVLLKNDGTLPLHKDKLKSLYITGPNAMATEALIGNYHGLSPRMVTFVEGITEETGVEIKTEFRHGALLNQEKTNENDWACFEAKEYDVTIVCVGLNILVEGEEGDAIAATEYGDRSSLTLPKGQHDFVTKILDQGKPIVLVVTAGCAIDLSPYYDRAAAIIYSWYPGETGGTALAELLFGKRDFSGKLPVSFPKSVADLPPFEDYDMTGRTYRYQDSEVMFPFGFGLGYRQAQVSSAKADKTSVSAGQSVTLSVEVQNPNAQACDDVVQIYLHKEIQGKRTPRYELCGFSPVSIAANGSTTLQFTIEADQISRVQEAGGRAFEKGTLSLWAGTSLPDARSAALGAPDAVKVEVALV